MTNYQIGDFLIKIKNVALAGQSEVTDTATRGKLAVVKALEKAGFVENHKTAAGGLTLKLKFEHKKPVLLDLKLVSKPGRRVYLRAADLRKKRGSSVYLLHSHRGVLLSQEAVKANIGGEVIAEVW